LAADSFAGEKERKTIEALLYSPISDRELFTAKLLGPWSAAVILGLLSFILYTAMVDLAGWITMKEILLPNLMWVILALWVSPAVAGLGLVVMVFVSARAQGFQDAYQLGGLVVLPVVALMAGQLTGVMFFTVGVVFLLGLVLWLLLVILLWQASRGFHREQLMQRG
jgi:ABC-type Na+ efflux pump permease subunit